MILHIYTGHRIEACIISDEAKQPAYDTYWSCRLHFQVTFFVNSSKEPAVIYRGQIHCHIGKRLSHMMVRDG